MKVLVRIIVTYIFFGLYIFQIFSQSYHYCWLNNYNFKDSIVNRISVPAGYVRIKIERGSFQNWLRHLPLKKGISKVYLFDGREKNNQKVHVAVLDIDIGNKDLQQCADAIIRLRAEYLYSKGRIGTIRFHFTSGHIADFQRWVEGFRPFIKGNNVIWTKASSIDPSYKNFKKYLNTIFMYAGTHSLSKELNKVNDVTKMNIGDVFIEPGFPGHAVIVVDMAVHIQNKNKIILLAQSFMPAQEIHILKNPTNQSLNPWYDINFGEILKTPEWDFNKSDLKRF